jgi:nucleoid-associated protein YgaU
MTGLPGHVQAVLREAGRPLDDGTRAFLEPRFGHDFGAVRVHTGELAARSAFALQARAYTVGSHVVLRDAAEAAGGSADWGLLSHELAHVVQQTGAGVRGAVPVGGVALSRLGGPAIQRKLDFADSLPKLGGFTLKGEPTGPGLGAKEDVTITFHPDPDSPATDGIDFIQVAKLPGVEKPGDWAKISPKEKLKSDAATTAGDAMYLTREGDSFVSVSKQHYGTADKARALYELNFGRLAWWAARQEGAGDDLLTPPLPVGTLLTIPNAVRGGSMVDIKPDDVVPRATRDQPNVSPNYPGQGVMTRGPVIGRVNGYKRADGSQHDSQMTDLPGGGFNSGRFEFESTPFAKDIGLYYGTLIWGFDYGAGGISNETAKLSPRQSDTFRSAVASFNRVYRNRHVVVQGDTLNSISVMYYGSTDHARAIYAMNKTNSAVTSDDPTVPIQGGTELEVGVGPTAWDRVGSGGSGTKKP